MTKRGQVTIFIIVGLVIVIAFILVLGLRKFGVGIDSVDYLNNNMISVEQQVKTCTEKQLLDVVDTLGKQGGKLEPFRYRMNEGYKISYLCFNIPNSPKCLNDMIFKEDVEAQIEEYLNLNVPDCIDLQDFSNKIYFPETISVDYQADVEINKENIVVKINYPVELVKGEQKVQLKDFSQAIETPLGNLLDTSYDIVNAEARDGLFLSVPYMIANRGEVEVFIDQSQYPDKIYVLNERNSDYKFQFAVEGESA